ncbi:hypothetical protein [Pseudemcibacter aquimaris]|uniref:hypothetical protein n=1 Tax=Pseudemcibacter aquimaris TaxID=2857064 RepID=UPI00201257B4|nr:hypothetical protein [Pseudemcibacter aquimaris]MCC3861936.1 hypothetical protein [Pseudemcibacter aquimaris]WDU58688.1 hypothetical protein KW060_00180 [Pseudemcibacter aquimaris]
MIRYLLIMVAGMMFGVMANAAPPSDAPAEEVSEFLEIPPINVAMYNKRKRPAGTMTVVMQLKIEDDKQRKIAEKIMPRLKNAYMQETMKLAMNYLDVNRPVNANMLGNMLQNITNQVLNHDQARVLISDIAVAKR